MKQTGICPKCQTAGAIRIKPYPSPSQSNVVRLSSWGAQFAHFDRYVCPACGFIEEYLNVEEKGWQKYLQKNQHEDSIDSDFV